ncbi:MULTISPECIES: sulfotransferase family protein [unclassified Coleofasciculus]|uniref:sulfotransferase family protein n=1 Tax=unclassified Coleofasciculus TaxID=2692782 RepID=UPI0018815E71|nr:MULTISPECIES: sulfotransferase [unclassified Coleofasciculus]MBE9126892.1 sulfotransferase [Coleofasciculus sp. LEGE 07081]MBE9150212.1 sulfotransferase [Coleofasciculus sp. LEGE 07092]
MTQPNFFIFSNPRSGSTLLCALLSNHSEVFCANDISIFIAYANLRGIKTYYSWKHTLFYKMVGLPYKKLPSRKYMINVEEIEKYWLHLVKEHNVDWAQWRKLYVEGVDISKIINEARVSNFTLVDMFSRIYFQITPSEQRHKKYFGEKTPSNFYIAPWLRHLYPEAKFITLVRNPITNVAALYKRVNNFEKSINMYLSFYDSRLSLLNEGSKNIVVKYEDVVNKPTETLTKIYNYLGAESKSVSTEFDYYIRQDYVGNNIDHKRDLKLKEMLDAKQKNIIMKKCHFVFDRFYSHELE